MKKTTLILACLLMSTFSQANKYPHHRMDFQTKDRAKGGISIANAHNAYGMFANPANLTNLRYGWDVQLLNLSFGFSEAITDFATDLTDATDSNLSDSQQSIEVLKVIDNYLGENFAANAQFSALGIANKFDAPENTTESTTRGLTDDLAFGILPVFSTDVFLSPHSGFGSRGILGVNMLTYGGVAIGASKDVSYQNHDFVIGLGTKLLNYASIDYSLTVAEIVDDDFQDNLQDNHLKQGASTVLDIGLIYELNQIPVGDAKLGLSYRNIGGIGDEDSSYIPATLDIGASYTYELTSVNPIELNLNYYDLLNGYDDENSFSKRLAAGADVRLLKLSWLSLGGQLGYAYSQPSFGADLQLLIFAFSYANYYKELGLVGGQDGARIHQFGFSIEW